MNPTEAPPKTAAVTSSHLQLNDLFWTLQGEGQWTGRRALFIRLPFCNYDCPWCDTEYNSFKKVSEEEFVAFCQQEPARFAVITGGEPMAHKDLKRIIMLLKQQGFYIACESNGSLPIPDEIDFPTISPKRYTQKKYPEFFIHEDAWSRAKEFKYVIDDEFDFSILNRHTSLLSDVRRPEQSKEPPQLTTAAAVKPSFAPPLRDLTPASLSDVSHPEQSEGPSEGPSEKTLQETPVESQVNSSMTAAKVPSLKAQSESVRLSLTPEYSSMKKQLPRILKFIQENPQWQLNLQTHKWIEIP